MTCPTPRKTRTGDFECPKCGLSWDFFDDRPECRRSDRRQDIARRELEKIRRVLQRG